MSEITAGFMVRFGSLSLFARIEIPSELGLLLLTQLAVIGISVWSCVRGERFLFQVWARRALPCVFPVGLFMAKGFSSSIPSPASRSHSCPGGVLVPSCLPFPRGNRPYDEIIS